MKSNENPDAIYPDPRLTALSRYSHEEICTTLDQWRKTEARFNAVIASLPDDSPLWEEINWLEPVSWWDGQRRSAGSTEDYPVRKWQKLIRQHEQMIARMEMLMNPIVKKRTSV